METPSNTTIPQVLIGAGIINYLGIPAEIRASPDFCKAIEMLKRHYDRWQRYYFVFEIRPTRAIIKYMRRDLLGIRAALTSDRVLVHFQTTPLTENAIQIS